MSPLVTRRDFLSYSVLTGAVSGLRISPLPDAQAEPNATPRRRTNFDQGWKFLQQNPQGAHAPEFDDSHWRFLDLPHDWSIEGTFSEDAPAGGSGAYLPTGFGWYRKNFTLPATTRGKLVSVQFDGVYQRSEVWINGISLGMRPYGFISFSYDLTPHLNPPGTPNQLAVRVDNSLQPNCRWYSGSGIYRHTWLVVCDQVHIATWGTCVRTLSLSREAADVAIGTRVRNDGKQDAPCELLVEILDSGGAVLQQGTVTQTVPKGQEIDFALTLKLAAPTLWAPATPVLYSARTTLKHSVRDAQSLDQQSTSFGIRDIAFDANQGFLLNGQRVKLNGVCIHGDGGSVGTAVPERVWERRLELLKQMGCNAIRLSHNPPAPELLDMLDRMGFLVMAEAFDEWRQPKGQTPLYGYHKYFDEWSVRDVTAMIERDRNHPCIVIWSAGNEVPDQTDPRGAQTLQMLLDIFHRLDPTRLVTVACDNIAAEPKSTTPEFLEKLDVVGYNYVDRWRDRREKYYSIDHQAHPSWRLIGTESIALYGARGVYAVDQTNSLFFERASNTLIEVEQLQKFIQTYDYVSGDFIWVGIDYLGESRWPSKLAASGALDTCGFMKDNFYFYQSIWTDNPVLHLSPHWNWAGKEGDVIPVICYTNCDTVELFLNGKSLGTKGFAFPRPGMIHKYGEYPPRARVLQTTADLHLSWDVAYAPGTLRAVGIKAGKVIDAVEVHTTGNAAKLALHADRDSIGLGPGEVSHVTVQVLDAAGLVVPTASNPIAFSVQGEGRILGVDNGQPDSHESYKGSSRSAFSGLALVLLWPSGKSGSITLSASSPALAPAQLTIRVG
jgi:beta-galactosidase